MLCFDSQQSVTKECFETILQTMAEAVFIVDTAGVIRYCNKGLEIMSGFESGQIIGKKCQDIMMCACGSMKDCGLMLQQEISSIECQLKRKDGTIMPILKNGRAMVDENGAVVGGVETLTDMSALKQAQRKNDALEEHAKLTRGVHHLLVGKSKAMQDVFELIDLAAASNATVLITGETGTGKELAARCIHERSFRNNGPMIKVNCSALPESLLESELFGHAKGAFTGAIKDKIGRFESADGGTLFLDEIGDVSPYIQVKLLRFLQEREFERVGESLTRKADVRIITATNRDLRALVRTGEFREDLYYRLKVFPVNLPPLRERKDDIAILISHFIGKYTAQTGKQIKSLDSEAALTMMDYCWPGNIRELENAIEHAFVTCKGSEIGIFDLPLEIRHVELRSTSCFPVDDALAGSRGFPQKKELLTKNMLEARLVKFHGNRFETAQSLGIDRTTLWRYMKKWGI